MAKVDTIGEHTFRRRRKKASWSLSCFFSSLCAADSQPIFSFEVAITVRWQAYAGHVWQTLCGTCTPRLVSEPLGTRPVFDTKCPPYAVLTTPLT